MEILTCVVISIIGSLIVLKLYLKLSIGWCRSNVCLVGKTVIVTGANAGIGYETAADFAKRGAKVILACRDETRGQKARDRIIQETDNPKIFFRKLDLASLASVREFAEEINNYEERLDILVNNAGAGTLGSKQSDDGFLLIMQVNYFGHFLLTNLLLDLLKKTPHSRIVNVSSIMAAIPFEFNVDELNNSVKGLWETKLYSRSKLCNILFTIELAKKLKGTTTTAYSLHPGAVYTDIFDSIPQLSVKFIVEMLLRYHSKSPLEGAQTTIYCSIEKGIEPQSGHHFDNCKVVNRYRKARDRSLPENLWKISEKLVGLN